jgi:hypothetical protein
VFAPGLLSINHGGDALQMMAQDPQAAGALPQGLATNAQVRLKDGRLLDVRAFVDTPRPSVALISASVQLGEASRDGRLELGDPDELPQNARLIFSVRAREPASFAHDEHIEVATADESAATTLSLQSGSITLERAAVAVAVLDPAVAFGPSVFGALKFRVALAGVSGDWQPLATLVRLPTIADLRCPSTPELACKLSGVNLFLIDSLSTDREFTHPVPVPDGFPGYTLPIPQPTDGRLYLRLRDDPAIVNPVSVPVVALPPSAEESARAEQRHAAAVNPPTVPPDPLAVSSQ